jgi:hypothetical protein
MVTNFMVTVNILSVIMNAYGLPFFERKTSQNMGLPTG